jgi:branched-chain amino acid aminotransferase
MLPGDGRRPGIVLLGALLMTARIWLNGQLVEAGMARIDPSDRGLLLGDGLFETMRAVGGRVPLLARHLARLRAAAALLDLPVPAGDAAIEKACAGVLEANGLREAALRLTLTCGPGPRGLLPPAEPTPTLLLAAFPLPAPLPAARACIAHLTRRNEHSPLSRLKTLGYLDNLLALKEARTRGADEAVLVNTAGRLACASTANLFVIEGACLLTPPLAEGALPGVTRALVIECAAGVGLACRKRPLLQAELARADGAFLTGSLAGLRPLLAVDGQAIGAGMPHKLIEPLAAAWRAQADA